RLQDGCIAMYADEIRAMSVKGVDVERHAVAIEQDEIEHDIVPVIGKQANSPRKAPLHLVSDRAAANPDDWTVAIDVVEELDPVPGARLHADVGLRQHLEHRVDAEMQEGTGPAELERPRQRRLTAARSTVQEHDHACSLDFERTNSRGNSAPNIIAPG